MGFDMFRIEKIDVETYLRGIATVKDSFLDGCGHAIIFLFVDADVEAEAKFNLKRGRVRFKIRGEWGLSKSFGESETTNEAIRKVADTIRLMKELRK